MYRFVTDSVSGLSAEEASQMGIAAVVPSYVRFGDESFRENVDITPAEFHARLKSDPRFPTTSAASVGEFQDVFERYRGDTIICITVSRELSGIVAAAENAAELTGGDIVIIDSRSASAGEVLLIYEAQRLAAEGKSSAQIKASIEALIPRSRLHLVVDTLENLHRGGRIGGAAALIGGMLQTKPILTIRNGRLEPLERVRTHAKAVNRLKELVLADLKKHPNPSYMVLHAASPQAAAQVAADLARELGTPAKMLIEVGASVAAHAGPGAVGVAYID